MARPRYAGAMTNSATVVPGVEDVRELTEVFGRQLLQVRARLAILRGRGDRLARVERHVLLQHEAAWQLGIVLLRRARMDDLDLVTETLTRMGEQRHPMGQICDVMATMIAIRRLWASAPHQDG